LNGVIVTDWLQASKFNPGSWWLLALGMAVAAGASSSWLTQLLIAISALAIVSIFREDAPWSRSVRFYFFLALFVVAARVIFRIIFNVPDPTSPTALRLPGLVIDIGFGPEISLLGEISTSALEAGATDGLRLAAIILSIGMASSLANPRRLLKATPSALYEIASSISVAINLAPQLIASLQRVRKARALRGRSKGLGQMAGTVIPVLEDAIDSSLALAASMDARGFGRRGELSPRELFIARSSSLVGIALLGIGSFLLLAGGTQVIALALIVLGLAASYLMIRLNSKAKIRTRYQPERFGMQDFAVLLIAIVIPAASIVGWFG
jgi:energy-coupling factor transport system permease protein